jgi:hypothetical protein
MTEGKALEIAALQHGFCQWRAQHVTTSSPAAEAPGPNTERAYPSQPGVSPLRESGRFSRSFVTSCHLAIGPVLADCHLEH